MRPVLWEEHKKNTPTAIVPAKELIGCQDIFHIRYFKAFLHKCKVSVKNLQGSCNMQTQTGG